VCFIESPCSKNFEWFEGGVFYLLLLTGKIPGFPGKAVRFPDELQNPWLSKGAGTCPWPISSMPGRGNLCSATRSRGKVSFRFLQKLGKERNIQIQFVGSDKRGPHLDAYRRKSPRAINALDRFQNVRAFSETSGQIH
jgi:hypothetical protein